MREGEPTDAGGMPHESPWYTLREADVLARRWEAMGPGWKAAYDARTDVLTFSRPGRVPQTFRPVTIGLDGRDMLVWALGTLRCG